MSQGGRANPYSGQVNLGNAASHDKELLTGNLGEQPPRKTEVGRMQATAKRAEREELRATGESEVQPGETAAQVKAGAEYLANKLK